MDTGFLKVAAVSPKIAVGDVAANLQAALSELEKAKQKKIGVLVFPELFLCGATLGDLTAHSSVQAACEAALYAICKATAGTEVFVCIGAPVRCKNALYDCAVAVQNGTIVCAVPKSQFKNQSPFGRPFQSGCGVCDKITLCGQTVPFGSSLIQLSDKAVLGIEFYDEFSALQPKHTALCTAGANVIACLGAQPALVGERAYTEMLLKTESAKAASAILYAGAGTGESSTDYVFSGKCAVAENGSILAQSDAYSQDGAAICADIDLDRFFTDRARRSDFSANVLPEFPILQAPIALKSIQPSQIERTFSPLVFLPENAENGAKRAEEILQMQTAALAKRMQHIGLQKLILGLSGGLDSTLALLVSVRTLKLLQLPAENMLCVTLPGFGTTDRTYQNALALAKAFGCTLSEISIVPAALQHFRDIAHNPEVRNATYENAQARERTQILMDLANENGALLVGTGDLSELALGWCTYNADHMSMYGVNADIPKTLVQYLVQYEADRQEENTRAVLLDILATPISPELLPPDENGVVQQKTEHTLGPYEVHDFYLYYFLRYGFSTEKLLCMATLAFRDKYTEAELKTWLQTFIKRFFSNQFKRSCLPDGPKIGTVGLSPRGDLQMPSDAVAAAFLNF